MPYFIFIVKKKLEFLNKSHDTYNIDVLLSMNLTDIP